MASDHVVWSHVGPAGTVALGIVARRTYAMRGHTAIAMPAVPWRPRADDLLGMFRATTDVVLEGSAHSLRGPVTRLMTRLMVGPVHKRVEVVGDRRLLVGSDGSLSESAPASFTSMPLCFERAYGGRDEEAEALVERTGIEAHGALTYPRNPRGCGYWFDVERGRLHGRRLPNLQDPDDPVAVTRLLADRFGDWIDRPIPAAYAPIDGFTFPRILHNGIGVFWSKRERPVREVVLGALDQSALTVDRTAAPDVRACNAASPGLATALLRGDEKVSLWNLHRRYEHLELSLPGEVPRMLVEPPNTKTFELEPKLATVHIEPDEDRITLTWAGSMAVGGIYSPEICAAMRRAVTWN